MSEINLSEGQEFFIGGQRYVVKDGVPVQEAKRGPLGGELVEFNSVEIGSIFYARFIKENSAYGMMSVSSSFNFNKCDPVEINVPQQAKGRVMTAGEAAKLPDIVGKRVNCTTIVRDIDSGDDPLKVYFDSKESADYRWLNETTIIEVLD